MVVFLPGVGVEIDLILKGIKTYGRPDLSWSLDVEIDLILKGIKTLSRKVYDIWRRL